ncbi:dihydrodipicolinate reductase [Neolewinella xylanilytica]|uniref:4-hydroxy-tetrahydrodipicolinate reductase n=1 Tax=Neolewinella xylanilytica TaxID=1514080 RepID=A0A2S6I0J9_9BACT|nr:4-hydroxy-tetrahydrodipicolinate reductase [Neolewinella xylanilytica]PPK84392.1 dihydrodipicolinate reductase [Neolewinella xylanilytica]
MKITLLGYGKMGRIIEKLATEDGHEVVLRVDENNRAQITAADLRTCNVAIDFSRPDAAIDNIRLALEAGVPVVVGTTGWHDRLDEVSGWVAEKGGALFYATNFSIGVNLFFATARYLASRIRAEPYTASIEETHHTEKLDAPSGTALTLEEGVRKALGGQPIAIASYREDQVPGTHLLRFASPIDTLEIVHTAHSREGFARGALAAAEWVRHRSGVFTMSDMLSQD